MKLSDLVGGVWAITPEMHAEVQRIYATHMRGEKIDIRGVEARLGRPLANESKPYEVLDNGIAVLDIEGVMAPKANLFMQVSGGVSTQIAESQIKQAHADEDVAGLILKIDSPGGSVLGVPELAAVIRAFDKPIVALTDGTLASAAYWVASQCDAVYATGSTVDVGSIGVVATHQYREADKTQTTEITAGKYKRITSQHQPLSEAGKEDLQAKVDYIYSLFVDAVALGRCCTAEAVLKDMADGRVFIGQQAVDAGLIDGFESIETLAEKMAGKQALQRVGVRAAANGETVTLTATSEPNPTQGEPMDKETLQQEHPELLSAIQNEAATQAASAERDRVKAVLAVPGYGVASEDIKAMAFDGKSSAGDVALAIVQAEAAADKAAATAFLAEAPEAAAGSVAGDDAQKETPQSVADETIQLMKGGA